MLLPDAASVEERRSTAATSANDDASIAAVHTGEEAEAELETDTSFGLRLELRPHRTYRRGKRGGEKEGREVVASSFQILAGIYGAACPRASEFNYDAAYPCTSLYTRSYYR
jgi:hypothetical protein